MPSNDSDGERADGGVDAVDFDTIEDEELPEWATEEASVPAGDASEGADGDASEGADGDMPADAAAADADEPVDAATAVNFANVETGASASVSVGEGEHAGAGSGAQVGWSRTEADYGDTAGTSIDPDIDDVDPGELLDEIDDGEFPRPGADDSVVSNPPLVPTDPSAAFGLGAALIVAVGGCYLLLAAAVGVWTAMVVVLSSVFIVGFFAAAVDLFDRRD